MDRAPRLKDRGRELLRQAILQHGAVLIEAATYDESLQRRMAIFDAQGAVRAYVNVGGGAVSVGSRVGKLAFRPGLNRSLPPDAAQVDSVMTRFARRGVAVIHLSRIKQLAIEHRIPVGPGWLPAVEPRRCLTKAH